MHTHKKKKVKPRQGRCRERGASVGRTSCRTNGGPAKPRPFARRRCLHCLTSCQFMPHSCVWECVYLMCVGMCVSHVCGNVCISCVWECVWECVYLAMHPQIGRNRKKTSELRTRKPARYILAYMCVCVCVRAHVCVCVDRHAKKSDQRGQQV